MASQLTDEELREKLVEFGEDVGPVTVTTRAVWEKKLKALLREKRRSPVRNLNAFSSDDSEIDSGDTHRLHRKKRNSYRSTVPVINLARSELNNKHAGGTVSSDVFKKPSTPSPRGGVSRHGLFSSSHTISGKLSDSIPRLKCRKSPTSESLNTTFDVDTSDSDLDSESQTFTRLSPRLRYQNCTEDRNGDHRNFYSQHKIKGDYNSSEKSDGFFRKVINVPSRKTESYTPPFAERWSLRSSFERRHDKPSVNGYVSVDSVLNKEFPNGKVPGKTTNYSHCVSWMLVLGTAAFFILIGTVYMSEVQKVSQNLTKNNYLSLCCKEGEPKKNCIPKKYLKPALQVSRELHSLLAAVAGEYECQTERSGSRSRHMTLPNAKLVLREKILDQSIKKEFDDIFSYGLWLIWKHPDWQITLAWPDVNHISSGEIYDFEHISALESVIAAKSFWCRIQHSIQWTSTELAILALVVISVFISIHAVKYWKRRKELQEREMYDLVEKIIEILQQQDEGCDSGSNSAVYKAVVHVRDMLIPCEERKSKQWLWDKAVSFIEENESRIRVEERTIAGEGFKVWRWLSNSSPEGEGGRHGKVWQGQAFRDLGKGCPYGATPCLKIRNMFDPEVEYGDDWQICIQDAILEKCEGNDGIVHVAVDSTPSEGCVYLMCNSSEAAGKAFNALHGWWFDGKLVTVKYLRLERYLERFPSAEHCVEPLKPSNNERLSLSAPFFSSALERS